MIKQLNNQNLPKHIAIIMDGNRRWARQNNKLIKLGHQAGAKTLNKVVDWCLELGIQTLTVYAFSTENWGREEQEVNDIMNLLRKYLDSQHEDLHKKGVKVRILGESDNVSEDIIQKIKIVEKETKNNQNLFLNIAFNYGGRREIISATKKLAKKVLNGVISVEDIDEKTFSENLYNSEMVDPDLVIRTGGNDRISNFLLWQIAYSEFYFTNILWPDFSKDELIKAIINFQSRDRRYGKGKSKGDIK
jgi:undecaprenyl diphosphate synthase